MRSGQLQLRLGITLLLLGTASTLSAQAARAPKRALAEIPIQVANNKTILEVQVGGATRRVILDSGMDYDGLLLFDTAGIDRSRLHLIEAQIGGAGSGPPSIALFDSTASFQVGKLAFQGQRLIMLTSGTFKGFPNDGVIGYSLLGHYAVEIDYDLQRMRLYEAASFEPAAGWTALDIYFGDRRIPFLKVGMQTAHEAPVTLETYIDFASGESLELLDAGTNRYVMPAVSDERVIGRGLSGDVKGRSGQVSRLVLGPHELRNVKVVVASREARAKVNTRADAVVANNLLRRFNLVFDYAHSKLYVKPNRSFFEPF